jgi:hypothetical protein
MNINCLLSRYEELISYSSMIEAPPKMLEDMNRKITLVYAGLVLSNLSSIEEKYKNIKTKKLEKEILKITTHPLKLKEDLIMPIDLDLSGSRYENKIKDKNIPDTLTICFTTSPSNVNNRGLFDFETNQITIYIDNFNVFTNVFSLSQFNSGLAKLKETGRHELQHYCQWLFSTLVNNKQIHGLPPKKVRTNDVYLPQAKQAKVPHSLRDIEFFTNLKDSIEKFKRDMTKINPSFKKEFAKMYVGDKNNFFEVMHDDIENDKKLTSEQKEKEIKDLIAFIKPRPPFDVLIKKDFNKWKLACKIFWKEIFGESNENINIQGD